MRIRAIREASVPIGSAMRNAAIAFDTMTASALAVVTDATTDAMQDGTPLVGYAFGSIGRYAVGGILRERFIPRLLAAPPESLLDAQGLVDPVRCQAVLMANEKAGGHGERPGAIGLLDAALWDLRAKQQGLPLADCIAAYYGGKALSHIAVYGSCGHYRPGESLEGLRGEVARARDAGYALVKIKVGADAAEACARHAAAASAMGDPGRVALDANGSLAPDTMKAWRGAVAAQGPAWIEEPVSALDYAALADFTAGCAVPVATGENLFSFDDARNLLRHGGLRPKRDRVQVDMLLAYGVPEYKRMLDGWMADGWRASAFWPHAGHLFAAHVVAAFGLGSAEAAPDAAQPWGGFWDGSRVEAGMLSLPRHPGAGYEHKANLYSLLRPLAGSHALPSGARKPGSLAA